MNSQGCIKCFCALERHQGLFINEEILPLPYNVFRTSSYFSDLQEVQITEVFLIHSDPKCLFFWDWKHQ